MLRACWALSVCDREQLHQPQQTRPVPALCRHGLRSTHPAPPPEGKSRCAVAVSEPVACSGGVANLYMRQLSGKVDPTSSLMTHTRTKSAAHVLTGPRVAGIRRVRHVQRAHSQAGTVGGAARLSGCGAIRARVAVVRSGFSPPLRPPPVPSGSPRGDAGVHPTRGLGQRGGAHRQGAEGTAAPSGGNGAQREGVLLPER